jgi:outer membrane protein TolC
MEESLQESQSFETRTRLLYQNGEAAQADVVKASAQVATLEQAVNAARLESELASQELVSFWTRDVVAPLELVDVFDDNPPPPQQEAPQSYPFLQRLEFSLFDAQKKGLQAEVRRGRAALLPQLGMAFQYGIDSTGFRIHDRGYAVFVNLSVPLFDWNRARSAIQQTRLRVQQLESNRVISERTFSKEYHAALVKVQQLFVQISLTRRQAELAGEDLRLSRIRYEGGEGSALDVVTAQNQFAQARINYYTAIANYLNARAELEVAAGR